MYDIYTPMIADVAKKISFEEAKETVLKALAPLGEDYVNKVKEGFENRWIDVYENQGREAVHILPEHMLSSLCIVELQRYTG